MLKARDLTTGEWVALKLLHASSEGERFGQESAVLAELDHPAIVRHVAHGQTPEGRAYLAMEWLDGELLSQRLGRGPLSIAETLALARRLASGLASAQRQGVVHRDVKPSNVFLVGGAPDAAKLIDFGLARRHFDVRMTQTGAIVGTIAYMSPEQAQGQRNLDGRSDAFSLGAVMYACLTGRRPFQADDPTALLARVLLDDPTPLSELVPSVPVGLEELVMALLEKQPDARPSAEEVVRRIGGLALETAGQRASSAAALSTHEQRVAWLVLVGGVDDTPTVTSSDAIEAAPARAPMRLLRGIVAEHGGALNELANGVAVATFVGRGAPSDLALVAARCALAMREAVPLAPMALSTGLGLIGKQGPVGPAIDRGVEALSRGATQALRVDALTARLIGHRFEVQADSDGLLLVGERDGAGATRKLLGRPTPFVGRERELSQLQSIYEECAGEPAARAVLVMGPAGAGKSRLRYELSLRLEALAEAPRILIGRGDPMSAGSPFGLLGEAFRQRFGILDGDEPEDSRKKLAAGVRESVINDAAVARIASFLGELCGVPFVESEMPWLVAARRDRTLMGDAMRSAWLDWLAAETDRQPVVLILEDLHWGDLPTIAFVDAALGELAERPLLVVAFGRPETKDLFPKLWHAKGFDEIRLRPLRRDARAELVREVLGDDVSSEIVQRIVELSDGNAFHLEELIRAVAEGISSLPESVLGMVHSRLEALDPTARRVLRAGSVFGGRFWRGGVAELTRGTSDQELDAILRDLVERELLTERPSAVFPGEAEYVFRHSLVREGSLSSLTDSDRTLGHRLAGQWLEARGEADALALAEHFRLGGVPERAVGFYRRAAEQALAGNDLQAAIDRVATALECAPSESETAELYLLVTHAHFWRGEHEQAIRCAREALARLPVGSTGWFWALGDLCSSASRTDRLEIYTWCEEQALAVRAPAGEDPTAEIRCLARCIAGAMKDGRREGVEKLWERVDEHERSETELPPLARAYAHHLRAAAAYYFGDAAVHFRENGAAIEMFEAAGDLRNACNARLNVGYQLMAFGDLERAESLLGETLRVAERLGLWTVVAYCEHNLGLVMGQLGRFDLAFDVEASAARRARALQEPLLEGYAHMYLAEIGLLAGEPARAESDARRAIAILEQTPVHRAPALAALALALLGQGRSDEALSEARAAMELFERSGGPDENEARVRLAYAEACFAAGEVDTARAAIEIAKQRVIERASRLEDESLRRQLLERAPLSVRTLSLARKWGAPD